MLISYVPKEGLWKWPRLVLGFFSCIQNSLPLIHAAVTASSVLQELDTVCQLSSHCSTHHCINSRPIKFTIRPKALLGWKSWKNFLLRNFLKQGVVSNSHWGIISNRSVLQFFKFQVRNYIHVHHTGSSELRNLLLTRLVGESPQLWSDLNWDLTRLFWLRLDSKLESGHEASHDWLLM